MSSLDELIARFGLSAGTAPTSLAVNASPAVAECLLE
jgi:hypothetical protein